MMLRHLGSTGGLLIAVLSIACSSAVRYPIVSGPRDWSAHPAVVEIDSGATIFAISDIHGGHDRMVALFAKHHLIDAVPSAPGAIHWSGAHSILESQDWFVDDTSMGLRYAHAVGAEHIVFGHSPHSIGPDGAIAAGQNGALFRIDCGMSPAVDYSKGVLLRIRREKGQDVAEALSADGSVQPL